MFRSATVKLTAWYLLLAMGISLLFSVVVYNVGSSEIARSVDEQSERIYSHFPVFDNNPILRSNSDISNNDHRLLLRLLILNILVFVIAGLISYLLARQTLEPIEEAHEQQKRFTSDVSHELRTPLTALKMESEVALLNNKLSAKELRATLKSNLEEATKLEKLINNILRLSRLEADVLKENFNTLNSKKVAAEAVKKVAIAAKQRNIKIEDKVGDFSFHADQDSIVQLLVIILENAIKYSGDASQVKLEGYKQDDRLIFKVTDQGIGINAEALQHIFDRFYRSESSRNKQNGREGYGLGLSIAKMIADVHDGNITVSSQVGKGTEVEISLPIDK